MESLLKNLSIASDKIFAALSFVLSEGLSGGSVITVVCVVGSVSAGVILQDTAETSMVNMIKRDIIFFITIRKFLCCYFVFVW